MRYRLPWRGLSLAASLLVAITACGDSADTTTTLAPTTVTTATPTTTLRGATTSTSTPSPPDAQAAIDWFVAVLNGEELTEAEYESRFNEEFRRQVPLAEDFQRVLEQFRPDGPFAVTERSGKGSRGVAIIESAQGTQARIVADLDEENRLAALTIHPTDRPSLDDPPETVEESFARLAAMGTLRAAAAEVVDGECAVIEESDADQPAPLGSVFELYVLAALGEAVEDGDVAWDDEMVIREELKSVPPGVLQDRPAGATVSVLEAAELMISISDNTATDHLMDLLGRETVESVLSAYGNSTPELNTPLLNTREITALKVGPASGLSIQWIEGDEETKRAILDQISGITPADLPTQEWVDPIQPDLLEWFASPSDLCTLAVRLMRLADSIPKIDDILGANPGMPAPPGTWDTIWFKGGSEPGLLASWFVTRSDGRTFVTTGSVVDPERVIDTEQAVLLFAAARDLLSP